jgi:hypothetical protein
MMGDELKKVRCGFWNNKVISMIEKMKYKIRNMQKTDVSSVMSANSGDTHPLFAQKSMTKLPFFS